MKFLNRTSYIPMKAKLFICFLLVAFWSIGHLWATDDVEVLRRLFVKQALSSRVDAERVKHQSVSRQRREEYRGHLL